MIFLMFLFSLISFSNSQLVLDSVKTCKRTFSSSHEVDIISKDWTSQLNDIEIKFNLCGNLNDVEYNNYVAYVKNTTDKKIKLHGNSFIDGPNDVLTLDTGNSSCKLSVKLDCSVYTEEPVLKKIDECHYEASIFSPSSKCVRCGLILYNRLLDLRPLKKVYNVQSKDKNFSISICDINPVCGNIYSSCDITNNNKTIPLSIFESESIKFIDNKEILLHGKFKGQVAKDTIEKIFELTIKCNWHKNDSNLRYKEVPDQGKKYKFEIESSLGCIKLPSTCKFTDKLFKIYKYNLSKLYKPYENWEVTNVTGSRKIYLNLCGPSIFKENNSCFRTSQVCEMDGSKYISKGRLYTEPISSGGYISMSFISGDPCIKEPDQTYTTQINLMCSRTHTNPVLVNEKNCTLYINWYTPEACPEFNTEACQKMIDTKDVQCIYRDNHQYYYDTYNLTNLYKQSGYSIQDPDNPKIKYVLNVCGPVFDKEAPCKNAMVIMKFENEYDIRKKVKSLGKMKKMNVKNGTLVIETSGGDLCEDCTGKEMDYRSTIFFKCSEVESEISLISNENCSRKFLWKSKYACPDKTETVKSCTFKDPTNSVELLDFTNMKQTFLNLTLANKNYLFDLCGNDRSKCNENNCIYVPVNKDLIIFNNMTYLEFSLNRECSSDDSFNKTILEIHCDIIASNEHYETPQINNCILNIIFKTHRACSDKDLIIPLVNDPSNKHVPYDIEKPHSDLEEIESSEKEQTKTDSEETKTGSRRLDCTLKNVHTAYEYNISNLKLNISSDKCPEHFFSMETQTVNLNYDIPNGCNKNGGNFQFDMKVRVELKCNKVRNNFTERSVCFTKAIFNLPEACKLLNNLDDVNGLQIYESTVQSKNSNGGVIAASIVSGMLLTTVVLGVFYWRYRKRTSLRRTYDSISLTYAKDD